MNNDRATSKFQLKLGNDIISMEEKTLYKSLFSDPSLLKDYSSTTERNEYSSKINHPFIASSMKDSRKNQRERINKFPCRPLLGRNQSNYLDIKDKINDSKTSIQTISNYPLFIERIYEIDNTKMKRGYSLMNRKASLTQESKKNIELFTKALFNKNINQNDSIFKNSGINFLFETKKRELSHYNFKNVFSSYKDKEDFEENDFFNQLKKDFEKRKSTNKLSNKENQNYLIEKRENNSKKIINSYLKEFNIDQISFKLKMKKYKRIKSKLNN